MKAGGTPQQRADRLFLCSGKALADLPASVFVPGGAPAATLGAAARQKRLAAARQLANLECKVLAVVDSLGPVVDDTHSWVEKKLAQNYEELKQDMEREDFDIGGDDSDEEVRLQMLDTFVSPIADHFVGLVWLGKGAVCTVACTVPGHSSSDSLTGAAKSTGKRR